MKVFHDNKQSFSSLCSGSSKAYLQVDLVSQKWCLNVVWSFSCFDTAPVFLLIFSEYCSRQLLPLGGRQSMQGAEHEYLAQGTNHAWVIGGRSACLIRGSEIIDSKIEAFREWRAPHHPLMQWSMV